MNLSEIAGKEIVNLETGERLGVVGECDLILDEVSGEILALLIPRERGFLELKKISQFLRYHGEVLEK